MVRMYVFIVAISAFFLGTSFVEAAFEHDLYFGMRTNTEVSQLQEFFTDQQIYSGPVTGNFFALTREAVKKFQVREGIVPVAGYFGPKSRARANALVSQGSAPQLSSKDTEIAKLIADIKALQNKLQTLQKEAVVSPPPSPPPAPAPESPPLPVFTKKPFIKSQGFLARKWPFGVRYPYRVELGWALDTAGLEEAVNCTPDVKAGSATTVGSAELYLEPMKEYTCSVIAKENDAVRASENISFTSSAWVSLYGYATSTFPVAEITPFKIADFSIYNGSSSDVLFANLETLIYDEMDSLDNRGQKVYFILRNGKTTADATISKKEFTFITTPPKVGEPHRVPFTFDFDFNVKAGEEKPISLWVEQFKYVRSGMLKFDTTKIGTSGVSVEGGLSIVLTKEPPL